MTFEDICKIIGASVGMGAGMGLCSVTGTACGTLFVNAESKPPLAGAFLGNALLFSLTTFFTMLLCSSKDTIPSSSVLKPSDLPLKNYLKAGLLTLGVFGAMIPAGVIGDLIIHPDRHTASNSVGEVAKDMTAGSVFLFLVCFVAVGLLYTIGSCAKNSEETRPLNSDYSL